jgi:hypothetical protein
MSQSKKSQPKKPKGKYYRGFYRPKRFEMNDGYGFLYLPRYGDRTLWAYQSKDGTIKERGYHDREGNPVVTFSNKPVATLTNTVGSES